MANEDDQKRLLFQAHIKGLEPLTAARNETERKIQLRDEIRSRIQLTDVDRKSCRGKHLSLNIRFSLYDQSGVVGRRDKDLDNLLKIFCDVLPDYMDNMVPPRQEGLGLIDSDNSIFEIHCSKNHVSDQNDEGIDFEIYDTD